MNSTALHPTADGLEDFVLGRLDLPDNHRIVRHLLTGCPRCRRVTQEVWERLERGLQSARFGDDVDSQWGAARYDAIIDRAVSEAGRQGEARQRDRDRARLLMDELRKHPIPRQLTLIRNSQRFRSWALCEALLAESFGCRFDDPRRGLEIAEVALAAARRVRRAECGAALHHDLIGRAWAYVANARRVTSDLAGAEEALREAASELAEGTGDPLERALLTRFRAHLAVARHDLSLACGLYDQARILYRRCGETAAETAVLLDKGFAYATEGRPGEAVPLLEEGLRRLDRAVEPRRALAARHNLADCLYEAGRPQEALTRLEELRPVYAELGDRMNLLRLSWLEGKILADLGHREEAEAALLEARHGFLEREVGYEAARVALDLAVLYIDAGRTGRVRALAAEILPVFESRRAERETLAALVAFERAAQLERATVGMVRHLAERLRHS